MIKTEVSSYEWNWQEVNKIRWEIWQYVRDNQIDLGVDLIVPHFSYRRQGVGPLIRTPTFSVATSPKRKRLVFVMNDKDDIVLVSSKPPFSSGAGAKK